jgi:hypothetical protein
MTNGFRVWDGEEMHEPPHKYLLDSEGRVRYTSFEALEFCEHCEVMHSPGLTDAEGTEVFEGDYLQERDGDLWEVCWLSGAFMVKPISSERWESLQLLDWLFRKRRTLEVTVAGNRYEHPELMEEVSTDE